MIFSQEQQKYAFVLGHCPELSRAEIVKTLEHKNISFQPVFSNQQVFIIETNSQIDTEKLQEKLGGTVKISRITYPVSRINLEEVIKKIIIERLKDLKIKEKKFQFGFSYYDHDKSLGLSRIGLKIKKELKEQGVNSRFIVSKEPSLSSVIVHKEKLIDRGVDVIIIPADSQYYLGYTMSAQKFEEYSRRDYGRPSRDDKSGLLPPKLAKIMLNLSQADFSQTILDPFCGSGTILQEALLLGYKNIIGSDISERAVKDSQNNINWLKTKYNLDIAGVKIFQGDATKLSEKLPKESIDAIVSEPYLGPARACSKYQAPNPKQAPSSPSLSLRAGNFQILNIISELSVLYLRAFAEFYKVLKRGGKIVIVFPIIDGQKLEILEKIKELGFTINPLLQEERGSIIYSRPGQRVAREIFVFRKR